MSSFFRRVSISQKLIGSSLVFAIPIAILLTGFIQSHLRDVRFSTLEEYGNTYQRPLEALMSTIPVHMFAMLDAQSGNSAALSRAQKVAAEIDKIFTQLNDVQVKIGTDLQFTEEGLGKRDRIELMPERVESRWKKVKTASNPQTIVERHFALLDDIAGMISHCGDTSNLILDPDLDSYYLMDMTLLALPQTQKRLAHVIEDIQGVYAQGWLEPEDRLRLLTHAALLDESDMQRILASATTALNEDANFYGVQPSFQKNLPPALKSYERDTKRFLDNVRRLASAATLPDDVPAILQSGSQAAQSAFSLWNTTVDELDGLLGIRIDDYVQSNSLTIVLTIVATLAAGLLVFFSSRSILIPLYRISEFARNIAQGDFNASISGTFSGELADLAEDIASMVSELKIRLGFSQGILKSITAPFVVASPENTLDYTNQDMLDMLELPGHPDDYTGRSIAELLWNDPTHDTVTQQCLANDAGITKQEVRYTGRGGKIHTAIVDVNLLRDFDGNRIGCCALFNDITNLKAHESEIEEKNRTMSEVALQAQEIADIVTRASENLTEQIEQVTQGATVQSERTTETASAMEEMNASVVGVAHNANDAVKSADQARNMANEGRKQVQIAMDAIASVEREVHDLQGKMETLGEQTKTVGRIIAVITDIADQTNLLALNAAIEAARAGEAGRGFAVVADEVRKLAEKTMQATQEVTTSISSIQNGTAGAITATESVVDRMVESSKQAAASGDILRQIVDIVQGTAQQIEAIAGAAEEQARTSESITLAVDEVNRISVETSEGMDRASDTVTGLSTQAQQLLELIATMQ
ncbi:methyl-accepting chemotaxis protein [Desulfovibrio inopinatus]|uniref:methyl-accepting chemotaxis protein n=1 Tax=Desulfovibrio inopinatus TaxID=102109 RepID=UPI0003FA9908|nr:methyl-accepting chemotaxis protein [Desulfovibrio inopinatus]